MDPQIDPESSGELTAAIVTAAIGKGMAPSYRTLAIEIDSAAQTVSVKSESDSGEAFDGSVTLAEVAAELGADVAEDTASAEGAPAMPPAGGA